MTSVEDIPTTLRNVLILRKRSNRHLQLIWSEWQRWCL